MTPALLRSGQGERFQAASGLPGSPHFVN